MNPEFEANVSLILHRLGELAQQDPALSTALNAVGAHLQQLCGTPPFESTQNDTPVAMVAPIAADEERPASPEISEPALEPLEELPQLTIEIGFTDDADPSVPCVYASDQATPLEILPSPVHTIERLEEIAEQLQLKAEATRWALEHIGERAGNTDEFRARSAGREKHLWMLSTFHPSTEEDPAWLHLAACFTGANEAARLVLRIVGDDTLESRFGQVACEIALGWQAELARAVRGVGQGYDLSQQAMHRWLEQWTASKDGLSGLVNHAHADATELAGRMLALEEDAQATLLENKKRQDLLKKARFHARKIPRGNPLGLAHDWKILAATLNELVVGCGVPPSNVEIREILLPVWDGLPNMEDDLPGFDRCLHSLDAYLSRNQGYAQPDDFTTPAECLEIAKELLRGQRIVLIGGDMRPHAKENIERALELEELVWVPSRVHQSIASFKAHIMRPNTAVVVLAIRWASHSYGDIKHFCEEANKPLVRLTGGYGANQFASQILEQAGERLRECATRRLAV